MTARFSRVAMLRAGVLGVLGGVALFAACDTQMPTAAEIAALNVASAEAHATRFKLPDPGADTRYFIDGVEATAAEAHALAAEKVVEMRFTQSDSEGLTRVDIRTPASVTEPKDGNELALTRTADALLRPRQAEARGGATWTTAAPRERVAADAQAPGTVSRARRPASPGSPLSTGAEPLIIVDGRPMTPADLHNLDADQIAQIEVLKGGAASGYSDPRAANGVIVVTTKMRSAPR